MLKKPDLGELHHRGLHLFSVLRGFVVRRPIGIELWSCVFEVALRRDECISCRALVGPLRQVLGPRWAQSPPRAPVAATPRSTQPGRDIVWSTFQMDQVGASHVGDKLATGLDKSLD